MPRNLSTLRTQPSARSIRLVGATGKIRTASFDGRDHIVVPVVGLMQAVIHPVNAPSAEFVPVETLAKAPGGWNGRPVVTDHPFVDGQAVSANDPRILETMAFGMLFNTASPTRVAETGRLEFEAWLDPQKADAIGELGQSVIRRLEAGEPIEVSVGAIVVLEDESGSYEGKAYRGKWIEVVPDHLAMLPEGAEGACSNKMGCGARAARHRVLTTATGGTLELLPDAAPSAPTTRTEMAKPAGTTRRVSLRDRVTAFVGRLTGNAGMTDNELHRELDCALRAIEPGFMGIDDVDQSSSTVYYCCAPEDRWMTFQRTYVQGTGEVTLNDDRVEVEPVVRYEPVIEAAQSAATAAPVAAQTSVAPATVEPPAPAAPPPTPTVAEAHAGTCKCQTQSALSAQGEAMHKNAERIKALIGNPATPWTEADQPFLETLTDERLAGFEQTVTAAAAAPAPAAVAAPAAPVAPAPTVAAAAPAVAEMSVDDFMKTAPAEVKAIVLAARKADEQKRAGHIAALKAAQAEFSEAELTAMTTEQLERFERAIVREDEGIVAPIVDFSARRAAAAAPSTTNEPPNGYALALAKQKGAK